jgi:hypothetical protein
MLWILAAFLALAMALIVLAFTLIRSLSDVVERLNMLVGSLVDDIRTMKGGA